jgi:hypothetical protein
MYADACLMELASAGWVTATDDGIVTILLIDEHIPPPLVRLNDQRSKQRMRRMRERKRLCGMGDHSLCEESNRDVTSGVTRHPGSGRVGKK